MAVHAKVIKVLNFNYSTMHCPLPSLGPPYTLKYSILITLIHNTYVIYHSLCVQRGVEFHDDVFNVNLAKICDAFLQKTFVVANIYEACKGGPYAHAVSSFYKFGYRKLSNSCPHVQNCVWDQNLMQRRDDQKKQEGKKSSLYDFLKNAMPVYKLFWFRLYCYG